MNKRGRTSAFALGLAGGVTNLLFAIFALIGILYVLQFTGIAALTIFLIVALVIVCVLNLIGGCVCIRNRVIGGVLMLATAIPLLIYIIISTLVSGGAALQIGGGAVVIIIWLFALALSIIAGILCFIPAAGGQYMSQYGPPYDQQPNGQPYQQPPQPSSQPEAPKPEK